MLFTSEIKETAMIAVSLILLASLLGFIAFMFNIRSELSAIRDNEIYAETALKHHHEFNRFNESTQYGVDVITTIRDYYDTDTKVAVKDVSGNIVYEVSKQLAETDPTLVDNINLANTFPSTDEYDVVLVYEDTPLSSVTRSYVKPDNAPFEVYAIVFFRK